MSGDYAVLCKRMQDECMEFRNSSITDLEHRGIEFSGKTTPKLDGYLNGIRPSYSGRGRFVHQIRETNLGFWPNFKPSMTFARWRRADI